MQVNDKEVQGVLHKNKSEQHYQLRRYWPNESLSDLVEQLWLVDWSLPEGQSHMQQNLPDPNFHLVIDNGTARLMGPVQETYRYPMTGQGSIIGVKFNVGVLESLLPRPIEAYIDQSVVAESLLGLNIRFLIEQLQTSQSDTEVVAVIETVLAKIRFDRSDLLSQVQSYVDLIKNNKSIFSVQQLSDISSRSVRDLQRLFKRYVGFSPKWLIRKYRLHQVLEAMEESNPNVLDIVAKLEYTDQSHLIRDFKNILGLTPKVYLNQK